MAIILSVNAGSSSVKVSVYEAAKAHTDPTQLADVQISGLTSPPALLSFHTPNNASESIKDEAIHDASISSQADAFKHILDRLDASPSLKSTASRSQITHICHRIVHGGTHPGPVKITSSTLHQLSALTDLAPLHNGAALKIVDASRELVPGATQIAVFDSSFHQTLAPATYTYAIARDVAARNGLRRYGFHGISYAYIARAAAAHLGKDVEQTSLIALHLGSGASACAIRHGRSIDTSMGLTPASGLPGGTRAGDVDAALVFHMAHDAGRMSRQAAGDVHVTVAEQTLNQEGGWKALAGTADFGEISERMEKGDDEAARLAFDVLVDRIVAYVGAYYVKLDGELDALVFAGGIGEKGRGLRAEVARRCRVIGVEVDGERNAADLEGEVLEIGRDGARCRTLVVRTDEQMQMARSVVEDPELFET